ncbi:lysophospholipid acyltransferase family protein [Paludisphaera soli]|uniref:lysophospholipid acyltransferase family protein n=1 Tax=Paludisphaera soli TaxID=2712865 RepID=UPI0013ED6548|nr:lysophospholipid acyltransferase family protein [Paludisphaera soli]
MPRAARASKARGEAPSALPPSYPWFFKGFRKYCRRFVAKNFHALRVDRLGNLQPPPPGPLIVVMNHASWWDPMVALILSESFGPSRLHYAPMDAGGVNQYRVLERVGIFGIELETARGGLAFLRRCSAILSQPESVLWITPQGRFVDVRDRPVRFKEGLGRLLHRTSHASVVPLAIEYPFWNDRRPEILVRFGAWIPVVDGGAESADSWTRRLEAALVEAQDGLAAASLTREEGPFDTLVRGSAGVGGVYEFGRRLRYALRGQRFTSEHQVHQYSDGPPS